LDVVYLEVAHQTKNSFKVPWSSASKTFVSELARLFCSEEAIFVACMHMCASITETILCQVKDHIAMTFGTPCEIMEKGAPEELVTEGYVHDNYRAA